MFYGRRFVDIFGNLSTITQDAHNLLPFHSMDAVGNVTKAINDYRVIQPRQSHRSKWKPQTSGSMLLERSSDLLRWEKSPKPLVIT